MKKTEFVRLFLFICKKYNSDTTINVLSVIHIDEIKNKWYN